MAVYYKFKSAKDYSAVPVEGPFLSILQLKERIVDKMRLERPPDFDLLISNSQTNEEYADEGFLVPKNTSVLVRRVPGTFRVRVPVITEPKPEPKVVEELLSKVENPVKTTTSDWSDDFGVDLYEDPQTSKAQQVPQATVPVADAAAKAEEEAKIKAFCDASASEWQRQTQQAFVGGRGRGGGGRGMGRGTGFMRKTPPDGYVCHRCNEPGHYIQHCPTNKDPSYNIKRVKLPTGIPRTMLVANPDGSYAMPNGEIAVLRPNEELFEKEVVSLTSNKVVNEVPPELRCPLCKDVLKDAVLTSKCCFKSYCDRCIRNEIISKGKCVCGATHVLADDLLPNKTLRDAIERLLESNAATSSTENHGSKVILPDMESVLPLAKAASPVLSASVKDQSQTLEKAVTTEVKDAPHKTPAPEATSQGDEAEVESASLKDAPPDGNTNEEGNPGQQAKKNKPKRVRPPKQTPLGQQMPWMPDGIGPYGAPFWAPHPIGDGFMMPYGGPYNGGYGVPFDVPFNGPPLLPDPYAYAGMVPPPFPQRDFAEYPPYGKYPPMSCEEFEAKKAEAWRKHEHQKSRDQNGEDSSSRKRRSEEYDYRERDSERRDTSRDRRSSHHEGHSNAGERHKPSSVRDRKREQDRDRGESYRSRSTYKSSLSREESKRRRGEEEPLPSSRRVSVFLRVKQEEQERSRSHESHHRHHHRHHVDTTTVEKDNEPVKSVFSRIAPKM
ncbi:E3 ubiquitin ligase PQT3-like isoform X1 [Selaginella moellendorffii]|uniref:E3 ubiquitin ligase PQT3-like isoform X1 n=1 Tax=Selaginella moellendorffii TaxID=88036 RepID=UPI000D1C47DA|nr:E3 ubiquitin ligase PQT3-like isoform X1 [Selaginella moellendorffii]|eukprot:XP_024539207.1 E3 ubiquitin ligase PQT3-like isoform X1 [Selaginella moellendorffii]